MDHKKIAEENSDPAYIEVATDEELAVSLPLAQVHATLALVEQQRIANLIAYMQIHITDDHDGGQLYVDTHYGSKLMQEAAEGLGIKP